MTAPSASRLDLQWLLSPPAPGEVQIHVAIGEGTELTPEIQQALERLVGAIHGQDVTGHLFADSCLPKCGDLSDCGHYNCDLHNCRPLGQQPCRVRMICRIGARL
jgi:hypothetical protein